MPAVVLPTFHPVCLVRAAVHRAAFNCSLLILCRRPRPHSAPSRHALRHAPFFTRVKRQPSLTLSTLADSSSGKDSFLPLRLMQRGPLGTSCYSPGHMRLAVCSAAHALAACTAPVSRRSHNKDRASAADGDPTHMLFLSARTSFCCCRKHGSKLCISCLTGVRVCASATHTLRATCVFPRKSGFLPLRSSLQYCFVFERML